MKQITVTKSFRFAVEGIHVRTFDPGEQVVPDEAAQYALVNEYADAGGGSDPSGGGQGGGSGGDNFKPTLEAMTVPDLESLAGLLQVDVDGRKAEIIEQIIAGADADQISQAIDMLNGG